MKRSDFIKVDLNCCKSISQIQSENKFVPINPSQFVENYRPNLISQVQKIDLFKTKTLKTEYYQNQSCLKHSAGDMVTIDVDVFDLKGTHFVECSNGVYSVKNGEPFERITNARLSVVGIRKRILDDNSSEEILKCCVICPEVWKDHEEFFEIKSEQFKEAFEFIHNKFRDIFVFKQNSSVIEEYLSAVNRRDVTDNQNLKIEVSVSVMGWNMIDGVLDYRIGDDNFYEEYTIPNVKTCSRQQVFNEGSNFRNVGNENGTIEILWLFAHVPYLQYFLIPAKAMLRSVIFLKGRTNSLKTSVSTVISNVFNLNRNDVPIRLSSTPASLQKQVLALRDSLILIDDFSNTVGSDNGKMVNNAEMLIRAVGDSKFSSKMSVSDFGKLAGTQVRASILLTGEEVLGLDQSSLFRIITLPVTEDTFNGNVLRQFQSQPEILQKYFALFIEFLKERHIQITEHYKMYFPELRRYYQQNLKVPRLVDFAATMTLVQQTVQEFAAWCGVQSNSGYNENLLQAILSITIRHEKESQETDFVNRFLFALKQLLGTSNSGRIAVTEDAYTLKEGEYIGFKDSTKNLLWLRFEDTYDLVKKFWYKAGENWSPKALTLKEELLKRDISLGVRADNGGTGNEYLKRATKGSRKRMLVLREECLEKF